ncbi:hypothetical protein EEL31_13310 [Brevibacillus laterosporus]|uniref:Uncharacterized protein n=1 Tax=Brevibacillus laterosporus TaxID=1465 RepID=A0A518VEP6_BRELA|nr:hypothetical protein [Brevibacillus laterosporus]QDX95475.1 hypothetical protein EEL30_26350 [Brevibacillus laterosporus]RAP23449.1 hypothetical protein C2W64_03065 [Brevibacillus laterosporus]TPG69390.1 hypothetical protein EEL31_13310 [Brevibacillus laterosporus]
MAVIDKGLGTNMGNTNKDIRKEIKNDIIDKIKTIDEVKRTQDSILISPNFHLDSKYLEKQHQYKVEIQHRHPQSGGKKPTVSVVLVDNTADKVDQLKEALNKSLNDGHIYEVT